MNKKTNRAKQAEATKNKIYNCGVRLMRKHGFDNITVEEISKQAGVSVGTYYYYFKSKFDLFSEIYKRADNFFLKEVSGKLKSNDSEGKILEYFDKYAEYNYSDGVEMVKKLYTSDNKMFITKGRDMQNVLEKIIEEGQTNGQVSKTETPAELTRIFFIAARGVVYNWCLYDGKIDLRSEMKKIISLMIDGFIL